MRNHTPVFTVTFDYPSLLKRLVDELSRAVREVRRDPLAFIKSALSGDIPAARHLKDLMRLGFAIALGIYAVIFGAILLFWTLGDHGDKAREQHRAIWVKLPGFRIDKSRLPKNKDEAGGGGGGGNRSFTLPSGGEIPLYTDDNAIIAPTTKPQLTPPLLGIREVVMVDPSLQPKRDDLAVTGLPNAPMAPPSDGPGTQRGIGSGEGGGIGPGKGKGVGPGSDHGTGGGSPSRGGRPDAMSAEQVDSRPVPLNRPRPNYTEEARQNKIEGTVRVRVLVGSDGVVRQVVVLRGLPQGLNEEAIRAASQMRFTPAMKNGRSVSVWVPVDIEFNIR
ncbi:MAG TPA: energy transducer TonB [Blastocatellia bacterium]|nr:energy transducer TonB [Blastocatellia bacterium]